MNVPGTYPPYKINGFMVGCFLCVSEKLEFTYPQELRQEILQQGYKIDNVTRYRVSDKVFYEQIIDFMERQKSVCVELLKNKEWDMFFFALRPEPLQNRFWEEGKMDIIEQVYEITDKHVSDLIKSSGKDVNVFLVSDHGDERISRFMGRLRKFGDVALAGSGLVSLGGTRVVHEVR